MFFQPVDFLHTAFSSFECLWIAAYWCDAVVIGYPFETWDLRVACLCVPTGSMLTIQHIKEQWLVSVGKLVFRSCRMFCGPLATTETIKLLLLQKRWASIFLYYIWYNCKNRKQLVLFDVARKWGRSSVIIFVRGHLLFVFFMFKRNQAYN